MEYEQHSGHNGSYHPRNVLEEGTGSDYTSAQRGGVGDWMIFRLQSEERVIPTMIAIRNADWDAGLKAVSISGSADNEQFEDWMVIDNVHRNNKELQEFAVNPADGYSAWIKRFRFFRLEITQNHGYENTHTRYHERFGMHP